MKKDVKTDTGNNTILLIGNGPSTNGLIEYGLDNIPDCVDTFGMGAAYRFYKNVNWWPTYYAWLDSVCTASHSEQLIQIINDKSVSVRKFWFSRPLCDSARFIVTPHRRTGCWVFRHVLDMGYKNILLIGIECACVDQIAEANIVDPKRAEKYYRDAGIKPPKNVGNLLEIRETPKSNPNYFFDDYQLKGDIFSRPRIAHTQIPAWQPFEKKYVHHSSVSVVNCSPISKLKFTFCEISESFRLAELRKEKK